MQLFDKDTQQALEQLGARITRMPQRYEALHFPNEAGTVTFIIEAEASPEMQTAIVKRALEVAKLASQIAKVSNDQNLSDEGKRSMRRTLDNDRIKLAAKLESDSTQIEGISVLAHLGEEQLYAPPAIEHGDFETAMLDGEIRRWFAALDAAQLPDIQKLSQRQLEALTRSPVTLPEPLALSVDAAWEQYIATERAREFKIVQADLDNARFAVASIGQLRQAVERLKFNDAAQVIRPAPEEARAA